MTLLSIFILSLGVPLLADTQSKPQEIALSLTYSEIRLAPPEVRDFLYNREWGATMMPSFSAERRWKLDFKDRCEPVKNLEHSPVNSFQVDSYKMPRFLKTILQNGKVVADWSSERVFRIGNATTQHLFGRHVDDPVLTWGFWNPGRDTTGSNSALGIKFTLSFNTRKRKTTAEPKTALSSEGDDKRTRPNQDGSSSNAF